MKIKYLCLFLCSFLLASCDDCNNECFNFWNGERITFIDNDGNNLLDPEFTTNSVEYFTDSNGNSLEFIVKDYIFDENSPEGIWHFETISESIPTVCLEMRCNLFIKFDSRDSQDTISMIITKQVEDCCTNFVTQDFSFNGRSINEREPTIGGYVINLE